MTAPARFKQADLQRALKAAKSCGYDDVRVKIGPDGLIELIVGKPANDEQRTVELD